MSQPPAYNRDADFTKNHGSVENDALLNAELDDVSTSINAIRTSIATVIADDGGLKSGIVTKDNFTSEAYDELVDDVTAEVQPPIDIIEGYANTAQQAATASAASAESAAQDAATSSESAVNAAASAASAAQTATSIQENLPSTIDAYVTSLNLPSQIEDEVREQLDDLAVDERLNQNLALVQEGLSQIPQQVSDAVDAENISGQVETEVNETLTQAIIEGMTETLGYSPADDSAVVKHTTQTLTTEQALQARTNIGAFNVNDGITATGSTTARTLANRFADVVNVKDFGAKGDGVADDTSAFSSAVAYAVTKAIDNRQGGQVVVMDSEVSILVPAGRYIVSSLIPSADVVIRWLLFPEAKISGIDYLGGVVDYISKKIIKRIPYGNYDKTNTLFVASGCPATTEAPLSGFNDYDDIVPYTQCDVAPLVAASYDRNTLIAKLTNVTVSGNNLTGLSLTDAQMAGLRKGMRLYAESPSSDRYVSTITGWTTSTIECSGGWYAFAGASTAVPLPSGSTVWINGKLSFFAHHNLVSLTGASETAQRVNVQENAYINTDTSVVCGESGDYTGGYSVHLYDARSYGTTDYNRATVGYVARGNMWHGFSAGLSQKIGFSVRKFSESDSGTIKEDGFIDYSGQGRAFTAIGSTARMAFNVNAETGNLQVGDISTRENASISFHSSGDTLASFDSIIYSTTTSGGNTYLAFQAGYGMFVNCNEFRPQSNNATNLGNASFRWKEIFCTNGTINTSDERLKDNIIDISDDVLDAWGDVNIKVYQFKDAIEKKGEGARLHTGVIAQQVRRAFEARGLNAFRYGLLCHDDPQPIYETRQRVVKEAETDDEGNVIFPAEIQTELVKVGMSDDIYSIRYEEALVLEAAYQRRRADRIEARLEALEERMA